MILNFCLDDKTLLSGILEEKDLLGIECGENGINVTAKKQENGLSVSFKNKEGEIRYSKKAEFFRALSLFKENIASKKDFYIEETPKFRDLGVHYDNSRNGVMTVETIKKVLRMTALMGFNQLYLYTEDTYEIKDYPYFGYFRGRFTKEEIQECDSYAKLFGIELVPCVQMLAHLNGAFKWDCFKEINDCDDILLIGDDRTYKFIEAAVKSLSEMFTSRNINIGMDEAHMVGLGKYLDKHGYTKRFNLMMEHLKKVIDILHKYGFKPTMWSDMFFKLLNMGYYDDGKVDKDVIKKVPKGVSLCYWDYYKPDKKAYDDNLNKHLQFENEITFAGGAWKWMGLAPCNRFSLQTSKQALESCYEHGIKSVMVTGWGDNGAECSSFATLPAVQYFAEYCYDKEVNGITMSRRLRTCTGANFEDFMNLDNANLPTPETYSSFPSNPSKYLLYQDVLCGLFDRHVEIGKYNSYFKNNVKLMQKAKRRNQGFSYIFETSRCLNELLALKCDIGLRIKKAYDKGDREALESIAENDLKKIIALTKKLHGALKNQWYNENKIFGFDVLDMRFGALKEREQTAIDRINDYLFGNIKKIEELEVERLDFTNLHPDNSEHVSVNLWSEIVTVNTI